MSRSLGDALGLTITAVAVATWRIGGTTALPRQVVLVAVAAALIPVIAVRVRSGGVPGLPRRIVLGIAWGLVLWTLLSSVVLGVLGSAPWITSIFGWSGRGIGLLTTTAVAVLLTAASLLTRGEIRRLLVWVVVAACINAGAVLVQALTAIGNSTSGAGHDGTLGNSNFAAAFSGIALPLAATLTLEAGRRRLTLLTVAFASATALLAAAAAVAGPLQGPLTAVIGVVVAGLIALTTGPTWSRWLATGLTAAGVLVLAMSVLGAGPLAPLWQVRTLQIRMVYWETALAAMPVNPFFGVGPDGFARVVGQFRPEDYLAFRSPEHHVSAAHDVPLQLGATIGVPGLVLWIALLVAAGVALVVATQRGGNRWIVSCIGGALAAYAAQALISIDMVALLALGWVLIGCAAALSRPTAPTGSLSNRDWLVSATAGVIGLSLMVPPVVNARASESIRSLDEAASLLESPWTPCVTRGLIAKAYAAEVRTQLSPLHRAWLKDPRCPGVGDALAEAELRAGNAAEAVRISESILASDPLLTPVWFTLGLARVQLGDLPGAINARNEARRTKNLTQLGRYREEMRELKRAIRTLR